MVDEASSELETAVELLHRKLDIDRAQARAVVLLLIPWLIKRHKRLS